MRPAREFVRLGFLHFTRATFTIQVLLDATSNTVVRRRVTQHFLLRLRARMRHIVGEYIRYEGIRGTGVCAVFTMSRSAASNARRSPTSLRIQPLSVLRAKPRRVTRAN